ncbi:glycine amidinotransferase- mitochondrial [Apiospora rasikravindrae]|uniref:Glycine amidinotransferase, mitochondrial n=1 Tax=Apiospora rasikravindrae TaxID=990691 RepID=A0ABR1T4X4_9PEZI
MRKPFTVDKPFSDNEWSRLIEVVVGRASHSCFPHIPVKALTTIVPRFHLDEFTKPGNPIPGDIVKKAEAELDNLAALLQSYGVKVRRPEVVDWVKEGGYTGSMLRDGLMVVGNTIIEAAFSWPCRRREIELLHGPMLDEFQKKGSYHIVRAPEPPSPDPIFDVEPGAAWAINNSRIAFDTADFTRIGRHVVGQLSNVTNQKGIDWVRAHLPPGYELVIVTSRGTAGMHIDDTLVPLRDGTALYYPYHVHLEELRRQPPLDTWRLLPPPKAFPIPKYPPPYMASGALAINVLVLDGKRVFCYHDDPEMIHFLERLGMEPIPIPFRHVACLGGSFHCATLDLNRERI